VAGWREIDELFGSFAPGGDLLVYLVGAKNVVELAPRRSSCLKPTKEG